MARGTGEEPTAEVKAVLRDALEARLRDMGRIQAELASAQKDIQTLRTALRSYGESDQPSPVRPGPPRGQKLEESATKAVLRFARSAIEAAGKPLTRREIHEAFIAAGNRLPSPDPEPFVGRALWASKEFEHVRGGYWVKALGPAPGKA